jgi:hypothetical protein
VVLRRYGQAIEVDEGIAPLISALWRAGIDTKHSCQGGEDPHSVDRAAYVAFSPADLARFDRLIADQPSSWERETSPSPVVVTTAVRFPPSDIPSIVETLSQHPVGPDG